MFQSKQKDNLQIERKIYFKNCQKKISGTVEVLYKFRKFDNFFKRNCFDFFYPNVLVIVAKRYIANGKNLQR